MADENPIAGVAQAMMQPTVPSPQLPPSAAVVWINLTGLVCMLAAIGLVLYFRLDITLPLCLGLMAAYAVPILLLERLYGGPPSGWKPAFTPDAKRVVIKLLGLYFIYGLLAGAYWLFPIYQHPSQRLLWQLLELLLPYAFWLSIPYILYLDGHLQAPEDSYWRLGRLLLGDRSVWNRAEFRQLLLGWVIKGFFLPQMVGILFGNMTYLVTHPWPQGNFLAWQQWLTHGLFTLDVLVGGVGYLFALRLFDTHIRSTESTFQGWVACLICYAPFQSVFLFKYLPMPPLAWDRWLTAPSTAQYLWGGTMLALLAVYTLSTVNFGCRFSNLTHRGILTNGLYGLTKHPAYVAKNLWWWLAHIPFLPSLGWEATLRNCLLMLGVNLVYYWRARTEERHLSLDPTYVQYALAMNERSIFRPLARLIPALKYRPPAGWESRANAE